MCLFKRRLSPGETLRLADGHHGLFVLDGTVDEGAGPVGAGDGVYAFGGDVGTKTGAEILHFGLATSGADNALLSAQFAWPDTECAFRLDQVSFPPDARACRHTHPGPGIRCLTTGALEIRSDHHVEMMGPMSAWFEAAESPVQATAGRMPTAFVRAMILPLEFLGKPTLNILDPKDLAKPRLQTNRRFFDHVVRLRAD